MTKLAQGEKKSMTESVRQNRFMIESTRRNSWLKSLASTQVRENSLWANQSKKAINIEMAGSESSL